MVTTKIEVNIAETLEEVKTSLAEDQCRLLRSADDEYLLLLTVECQANHETTSDDDVLISTRAYIRRLFGESNVFIERDAPRYTPKSWRGSYENVDDIVTGRAHNKTGYLEFGEDYFQANSEVQMQAPWHLARIDQRFGFVAPNGGGGEYTYLNDARDIDVYTLDTGLTVTHPEFEGRAFMLENYVDDGKDYDCHGHGTHIAGLIASKTYGVAKKATVYCIKVLDCDGFGMTSTIIMGIQRVIGAVRQSARRSVISLSFNGGRSDALDALIRNLVANNIVVTVAAGNDGNGPGPTPDACFYSPSRMGRDNFILTAGASTINDQLPVWTNYGPCVSLYAPGESILSTAENGATRFESGTSMSAPLVAGVAALVLQDNPALSVAEVNNMIVAWATPKVLRPLSESCGSLPLLYSLIQTRQVIVPPDSPVACPIPTPAPVPVPVPMPAPMPVPVPVPAPMPGTASARQIVPSFMIVVTVAIFSNFLATQRI